MSGDRPCCLLSSAGTHCEHGFPTLAEAEHLRLLWFNENSAAQAALGRVRELCNEWSAAGGIHRFHADLVRDAIDGEDA